MKTSDKEKWPNSEEWMKKKKILWKTFATFNRIKRTQRLLEHGNPWWKRLGWKTRWKDTKQWMKLGKVQGSSKLKILMEGQNSYYRITK